MRFETVYTTSYVMNFYNAPNKRDNNTSTIQSDSKRTHQPLAVVRNRVERTKKKRFFFASFNKKLQGVEVRNF
jgi:hypothetical protein